MKWVKRILFLCVGALLVAFAVFFQSDIPVDQLKEKYAPAPSGFMDIDGMQVHFRQEGSGMPLLLLHGTSSSLHTWDGWTAALQDSFRVIRFDLPAFGLTGPHPGGDYSIQMYMQVIRTLLDSLGVDSCAVAGNSLGGYIAWNYAAEYPQQVKKLILLDAVAYTDELDNIQTSVADKGHSLAFQLARNPMLSWAVRWLTPRSLLESSLKEVYYDDTKVTDQLVTQYFDMVRRTGNRKGFIDNVNSRVPEGREKLLPGLQTPVLIQWGKQDLWVDISMAHWFSEVLPNDTLLVYDKAGHIPMEEIAAQTAADARRFLLSE